MKSSIILLGAVLCCVASNAQADDRAALGVLLGNSPAITRVVAGSPAAQIGLAVGDRILAINGQPVKDSDDVVRMIGANAPGTQVTLDTMRGTSRSTQTATLSRADQVFKAAPVVTVRTSDVSLGGTPHWVFPDHLGAPIDEFDKNGMGADWSFPGAYAPQ